MNWESFSGKRIGLVGAGGFGENLSLVPHLLKAGATLFICDMSGDAIPEEFRYHYPEVKLVLGEHHMKDLGSYDYVFRSPGVPVSRIEEALKKVKDKPFVTSATDLFLAVSPSFTVGVTGTKGKGTTSTMIGNILEAAGKKVVVAGNIGKPIFSIFDSLDQDTIVVLELSSFQLEDVHASPRLAVVLPISEDHLQPLSPSSPNFHPSMNDYVAAKAHITLFQNEKDTLVFAADNPESTAIAQVSKAKRIGVSLSPYQNHWNVDNSGEIYHEGVQYASLSKTGLKGYHLFLNATLAIAATSELGVTAKTQIEGLRKFKPLPHRMQDLGVVDGIRYVDDSYATAPDATKYALTAFDEPIVLIAGGSSKGVDFAELAQEVAKSKVSAVVLIGQEAPRLKQAISKAAKELPIIDGGNSMGEAVKAAKSVAAEGSVVLLSPACASKDMFKNAADRGEQFQQAVNE